MTPVIDLNDITRLLWVCRQIYTEAAVLPFQLNGYRYMGRLSTRLQALSATQRNAIVKFHIAAREVYGLMPHAFTPVATSLGPPDLSQLSQHLDLRVLGGLRTVVVEGRIGAAQLQGQTVAQCEEKIRVAMRQCAGKSDLIVRLRPKGLDS
jgi:hypothetical protein